MIIGIGTDLFDVSRISLQAIRDDDPFLRRSFTAAECAQASQREIPLYYYATRFAGKEAVYKAISQCKLEFRPSEIEILDDSDGRPHVHLNGDTAQEFTRMVAEYRIFLSLSFEKDLVSAFAVIERNN